MMGRIATATSFVLIIIMIMSCASTIPPALLVCKDEPRYTGRPNVSAADVLEFADKVAIAGADCRARLRAVKKIIDGK
ncbi:hypothetical protein [Rhizobium leguminosarum]|uniref:Uncharacterized protein n=1 Tax=Rhizobium leguminosarum TaxID=384 RepID=A0A7M3DQJ9_RHILE|nr:hypothetical protein [Rhizobium leguminosarum]TAY50924.1 hypothetical protein ELH90_03975 [Rhizobium leguminosarum]